MYNNLIQSSCNPCLWYFPYSSYNDSPGTDGLLKSFQTIDWLTGIHWENTVNLYPIRKMCQQCNKVYGASHVSTH